MVRPLTPPETFARGRSGIDFNPRPPAVLGQQFEALLPGAEQKTWLVGTNGPGYKRVDPRAAVVERIQIGFFFKYGAKTIPDWDQPAFPRRRDTLRNIVKHQLSGTYL